ncbi:MAG: MFS transporter [Candidatus Omnitrophica bacterium]|nr:MFS transporter [Candidatus Omnitrophota bacterium]
MKENSNHSSILSLTYFLFFAILGVFLPYFNLYCYHLDFSSRQIGALSAAMALMKIVSPVVWSHIADRAWSRRDISVFTSAASAGAFLLCLYFTGFLPMLIGISLYSFFRTAVIPLVEATTWEMIELRGGNYGQIRVWGSVGFILTSWIGGWVLDRFPLKTALYAIFVLLVLLAAVSFRIPPSARPADARKGEHIFSLLGRRDLFLFIATCAWMQISHGAYYGFFTIYLEESGYSRSFIGAAWGLSVICEVVLLMQYHRWFRRLRPETVLIFSCVVAAWRWWILGSAESLPFILLAQAMHAVTFAAFHVASWTYLNKTVPARLRNSGQGLLNASSYGLGGMIGLGLSGFLYDSIGPKNVFSLASVFAVWAAVLAVLHYFLSRRKGSGVNPSITGPQ